METGLDGCKEESEGGRGRRDESHSSLAAFLAPSLTVEEVKGEEGLGSEEPRGGTHGVFGIQSPRGGAPRKSLMPP